MDISYGTADFKAHCLRILDEVARTGQAVEVTKRGQPAVRVVPAFVREVEPAYGFLKGTARWEDGLLTTGEEWEADHA